MRTFKVEFDKQSLYTPAIIPPSIVICGAHSAPTKFFLCALCASVPSVVKNTIPP